LITACNKVHINIKIIKRKNIAKSTFDSSFHKITETCWCFTALEYFFLHHIRSIHKIIVKTKMSTKWEGYTTRNDYFLFIPQFKNGTKCQVEQCIKRFKMHVSRLKQKWWNYYFTYIKSLHFRINTSYQNVISITCYNKL